MSQYVFIIMIYKPINYIFYLKKLLSINSAVSEISKLFVINKNKSVKKQESKLFMIVVALR